MDRDRIGFDAFAALHGKSDSIEDMVRVSLHDHLDTCVRDSREERPDFLLCPWMKMNFRVLDNHQIARPRGQNFDEDGKQLGEAEANVLRTLEVRP